MAAADYVIEEVRAGWVGKVLGRSRGRYAVEHDPIRRWCQMIGDTNPLFLDPDQAAKGPYGAVIVPLPLIPYFAGSGPWPRRQDRDDAERSADFSSGVPTPGDRGINMGCRWRYLVPVRVGDWLQAERSIGDVFVKAIRLDPKAVWITTHTRIANQRGEEVAIVQNTVLLHRSPAQIAAEEEGGAN